MFAKTTRSEYIKMSYYQQVMKKIGKRESNVIVLGVIFMVLFSGFFTLSNLEKVLLTSSQKDNPQFTGDAFISLCILYIVFALSIWIAPSVLTKAGPKVTIFIGTLGYSLFVASFYAEKAWVLYLGSVLNGLGAALLWTGQGHYMILNATPETIQKNAAIFAVIAQSSMLYGNLIIYFLFRNKTTIDAETRIFVVSILLAFTSLAALITLFLPNPILSDDMKNKEKTTVKPMQALKKAVLLMKDRNMLLMIFPIINMGFTITFAVGVYGPCVGFTLQLGNSKQLVPLNGFFGGIGEILVSILLIITSSRLSKWKYGSVCIMVLAMSVQLTSLCLIFLNIPNSALLGDTMDVGYIKPSATIALLSGGLLGVSDGTSLTMILSMLGKLFPNDSVQAVSINIFAMSLSSAASFFYSMFLPLHIQLSILVLSSIIGTISYSYVSKRYCDNLKNTIHL